MASPHPNQTWELTAVGREGGNKEAEEGEAEEEEEEEEKRSSSPFSLGPDEEDYNRQFTFFDYSELSERERLQRLEEEQEHLNSSLLALTTHFAQVQFRLKQIVDADTQEKEDLLKDLEEFAFRGIPDVWTSCKGQSSPDQVLTEQEQEDKLAKQRQKQKELIGQLKEQLQDLEQYAYETGDAGMPQSMLLERHAVIIEQLKGKLSLDLDQLDKMSAEDLRMQVDRAIRELVSPAKMKEQLVSQLKTQITDLERFIHFLQGEAQGTRNCTCNCPLHGLQASSGAVSKTNPGNCSQVKQRSQHSKNSRTPQGNGNALSVRIVRRAMALLQMFVLTQFGCGSQVFKKNSLKKTNKANHYGDLRAKLEVAIDQALELAVNQEPLCVDSDYTSDSEDSPVIQCNEKLTTTIRKDLSIALRDLLQHGLMPVGQSNSLVPLGCFAVRSNTASFKPMHAWDLLLKYYELKNGHQYNASPARRLSQSFNLEIVGGAPITSKQTLLGAIHLILTSHTPLKRSADSHFKAFVCSALNEKRLVSWLRLIIRCKPLTDRFYQPWSYVVKTGFEDAFKSLDKLNQILFDLPVDLAVRQLQNIKDVF